MKTRRLFLCIGLVLLATLFVVLPAQAGRPQVAEFVAWNTSYTWESIPRFTGGAVHYSNSFVEGITSSDPRFQGTMTSHYECAGPLNNPQATPDYGWGPCMGAWRLDVPGSGGWWEGNASGMPQSDFRIHCVRATGRGYGRFAGMKVEWIIADLSDWAVHRTVRITGGN